MTEVGKSTTELLRDSKPAHLIQYFTVLSVTMGGLSFGTGLGYTSPAGPMLNGTLTEDELTWFSSIVNLGAMAGGPVGGLLINALGRKGTMMGSVVLGLVAWALVGFGQNFAMMLSGRIIAGLYTGITCLVVPTYIGEIASSDIRGTLGSSFQLMVVTGILYAYVFGAIIDDWRVLAGVCTIPMVIYAVLLFFVKESPTFLVAKGRNDQAKEALQFLRGKHYDVDSEFRRLQETQEALNSSSVTWRDMLLPYILKPVSICLIIMVFQQTSGVNSVLFNLSSIFQDANVDMEDTISAIIVGGVQVIATAAAVPFVDRAGRKILLICSASVMCLSLVALGVFFYEDTHVDGFSLPWLPLVSLGMFIAAFSVGYGPVPWVLMGEMFSLEVRAAASGLATLSNWGTAFLVTLTYPYLKPVIYDYGVYWMYASICAVNALFCIFLVPETKGKTVQEITAYFGGPAAQEEKPQNSEKRAEASV